MSLLTYIIVQIIVLVAIVIVANLFVSGTINVDIDPDGAEKWSLIADHDLDELQNKKFIIFRIRKKNTDYYENYRKEM